MSVEKTPNRKSSSGHARVKVPRIPLDVPGRYCTGNVLAVTGWSHSTLYNRIKSGHFPAPQKDHGSSMNYWTTDVIRAALDL